MSRALSLRARLLLGALLWTVGLFLGTGLLITHLMYGHPNAPRIFHGWFSHLTALSVAALLSMAAGFLQVRRGLSSFDDLRATLTAVRQGREPRLGGHYPAEVQPLVDELNALLDDRDERVTRALAKAGDLAHGLKTPLAILAQEAERAGRERQDDGAAAIGQQVERMRRQIDYHLAHARAAASTSDPATRCQVRTSVDGLVRALLRLHDGRGLSIDVDVSPDHLVRARREDLDEMLGNLLDNACTWAASRVAIRSGIEGAHVAIAIDDDGPGIDPSMRDAALRRGVRADEAAPGSGLGLAIVCDLAEVHGGSIALDRSPAGGARATLRLPTYAA